MFLMSFQDVLKTLPKETIVEEIPPPLPLRHVQVVSEARPERVRRLPDRQARPWPCSACCPRLSRAPLVSVPGDLQPRHARDVAVRGLRVRGVDVRARRAAPHLQARQGLTEIWENPSSQQQKDSFLSVYW